MLDEFGAIVQTCSPQALALLQRGRTHNGQVHVITQSIADVEALTGQKGLLDSLSDNSAGFVVHRQTSPDSRDWLAKLNGDHGPVAVDRSDQRARHEQHPRSAYASSASARTRSPSCRWAKR
jgi:hypothetical protein